MKKFCAVATAVTAAVAAVLFAALAIETALLLRVALDLVEIVTP